ncbi:MAG: methyltransferase domain-containing protein [Planctomycetota bacterium]|jgi:hypothetical protein
MSVMPLADLSIDASPAPLPEEVQAFLGEAEARIKRFVEARWKDPIAGFVPSAYDLVYRTLRTIVRRHLAPGRSFCEWGSGFGVVAALASMLDFDACGIEIEEVLVREARSLSRDFDLPVEFACGSFVPTGGEALTDVFEDFVFLLPGGHSGYEDLGLDPEDFDVIFAYPWPGDTDTVALLFEHYAATGAILVTYHGIEEIRVRRKVA